jgi:UDP-N-acetylglucosamine 3-dehydrogenase
LKDLTWRLEIKSFVERSIIMNKVRIGVIGTGMVTRVRHLPELKANKNVELIALASMTFQKASFVGKEYGIQNIYSGDYGWQELITNKDIDGIIISVPNYLHCEMTCAALKAKKHVLIEKPIATSLEEADEMILAASENNSILMVAHNQRFIPYFKRTKELIEKNILGKVNMVHMVLGHAGPENWVPNYWSERSNWFFNPEKAGGGAFLDIGIHASDLLLWLLNKKVSRVHGFTQIRKRDQLEDSAICSIKFEDETLAVFQVSWIFESPQKRITVYCEKGTINVDANRDNPLTFSTIESIKGEYLSGAFKQGINSGVVDHFVECIQNCKKPLITGEEARDALEVILAGYKSAKAGISVKIPLKS